MALTSGFKELDLGDLASWGMKLKARAVLRVGPGLNIQISKTKMEKNNQPKLNSNTEKISTPPKKMPPTRWQIENVAWLQLDFVPANGETIV